MKSIIVREVLVSLLMLAFILNSCSRPSKSDQATKTNDGADSAKTIYKNTGNSTFKIFDRGWQSVEVTYQVETLHFLKDEPCLAKFTTTQAFFGASQKSIRVEIMSFEKPDSPLLTIEKTCDQIILKRDYFEVHINGCCGAEDEVQFYDYDNQLIIEGTTRIVVGEIPNSRLKIYVAYSNPHGLYYSYNSKDKFLIKLDSLKSNDGCGPLPLDVFLSSNNKGDKRQNDHYTLWSLDKVDEADQINDLSIKLVYPCSEKDTLVVPIIHGKPFGGAERNQKVALKPI